MLFYLHRRPREQILLFKIFLYTCSAHLLLLLSCFFAEKYLRTTYTVLFSGRRIGSGAAVSFGKGTKKGQGTGSLHHSVPGAAKQLDTTCQNTLPKTVPQHEAPKKAEPKTIEPQEKLPEKALQKSGKKVQAAKKETKPAVPLYSELKRNYSTLKTAHKAQPKEFEKQAPLIKPQEPVKKEEPKKEAVQEKKVQPEPKKEVVTQETKPEPKKVQEKPQEAPLAKTSEALLQVEQTQVNTLPGAETNTLQSEGQPNGETLTIDFSDTVIADRFMREISQAIARYFRKPLGFDDHEHFTISFEICDQKARNISARGSEPLILYAALKEALLKATFSGIYTPTKVELVY